MLQDDNFYCDRCGIGTEHYWKYSSMIGDCIVCNDCLLNFIQKLICDDTIKPYQIVEWVKQNVT